MRSRKKPSQIKAATTKATIGTQENESDLRLRFQGSILELTPVAEFPIQVLETEQYGTWIDGVADLVTKARITSHVNKMRRGLFGDWKEVGSGVFEMRIDFGPGYRAYYARHGKIVVVLLGGGEKGSQQKDIADAQRLWEVI